MAYKFGDCEWYREWHTWHTFEGAHSPVMKMAAFHKAADLYPRSGWIEAKIWTEDEDSDRWSWQVLHAGNGDGGGYVSQNTAMEHCRRYVERLLPDNWREEE